MICGKLFSISLTPQKNLCLQPAETNNLYKDYTRKTARKLVHGKEFYTEKRNLLLHNILRKS